MTEALRWGIISTAKIAREDVIPGLHRAAGCEIVAIASRSAETAAAAADEAGIPRSYAGYEALLADDDIDAVYIPLPNHLHKEWTMAAADAGKHVLCEKPLALTARDAREMVDHCADRGVVLMEAFMYRYHPAWQRTFELLADGAIGELVGIQTWFSYYNDDPDNIRAKPEWGGGALMDIGCYPINISRVVLQDEPRDVSASMRIDPELGIDVVTSAVLDFGKVQSTFTVSMRAADAQRVEFVGTEGRLWNHLPFNVPPDYEIALKLARGGSPPAHPDIETITIEPADQYARQAEALVETVRSGAPPPYPAEDAVGNMEVIDGLFDAAGRTSTGPHANGR